MKIEVRKYRESDLDAVNKVLLEVFSYTKSNFKDDSFKEVVVLVDDVICGYLLITKVLNPIKNKYYCLFDYVCVSEKYRGLGLGEKLTRYAEEVALEDSPMYLQLSCSYFRQDAHKLYEKCGFEKRESDLYRKVIE